MRCRRNGLRHQMKGPWSFGVREGRETERQTEMETEGGGARCQGDVGKIGRGKR